MKFKVGAEVYSNYFGYGHVVKVDPPKLSSYPVYVRFNNFDRVLTFTSKGSFESFTLATDIEIAKKERVIK